ncbi:MULTISPECIES: HutD family protein [unclassified Pseudomonas]|uniref:HutD/Ves family protein n=1 Tax=unclassified Pseudomonas TaxID=196821 RepID=UPI000BC97841|nr:MULTISPECIES: HutD family protein [unclassified Pseudomonas]PVZ20662.1 hypothetical protein F474_01263 [Pseudomonas sp. URIL14HWK12:I12]PVZ27728.1 hypothetical protein F470_00918 [Pseudomonas sp. URIL14HWK12:I10]PVZ38617.1 hypothetical protein F472_01263 [Pseudomonas sp. URIL14HWK12:I11]SNZ02644.1 hypothetical protein SAMN05660463_00141 [Pseudomonas sp. URIL14HWK12:I9]
MSTFTRLPASLHRRMPWRNGLGTTLEIARDTAADDWGWRVSLADVAQSGAFSPFAGMTRIISVIQGPGMRLDVGGVLSPALHRWEAFTFSGDAQVHCQLIGGPIRDFNLIYRADRYRASLDWLQVKGQLQLKDSQATMLFCADGALSLEGDRQNMAVGTLDAVLIQGSNGPVSFCLEGNAQVCLISLQPIRAT